MELLSVLRTEVEMGMKTNKHSIAEYDDLEMPSDDMDTDIRNWHSYLVKVRKDTKCVYCGAPISKGDFALSERGFCDGEPFMIHDCIDCVDDLIAFQNGEIDSDEYLQEMGNTTQKICRTGQAVKWE